MRKIVLCAALAAVGIQAFAGTPGATMTAFHAALAAGDKAAAIALLSPDVVIFESGHVERTRDEYTRDHLASDIAFSKTTTRKVSKHLEHEEGNSATVLEETDTKGAFKGKPVHALGLETALLEKQGDGWVIVHLHWSSRPK